VRHAGTSGHESAASCQAGSRRARRDCQAGGDRLSHRLARQCLALLALALLPAPGARAANSDDPERQIVGRWLTEHRNGIIEIGAAADGSYQGRIVGGDTPNRTDAKNPDPAKRSAQLLGQLILVRMRYDGHGQWSDGSIYDPDTGHTYRCHLELLDPNRLKVRGFMGVSLLGRTQIWTRYTGTALLPPPAP
jgi:uncharacterized protein (DUF2147 family)